LHGIAPTTGEVPDPKSNMDVLNPFKQTAQTISDQLGSTKSTCKLFLDII
jgi:hypothetical protein